MTTRQRNLAVLLVIGALAAAGAFFAEGPRPAPHALDAVPDGAFLVASVDVGKVRAAGVLEELGFVDQKRLDDVTATCGFDPIDHARELVVAMPEDGAPGEFGVAATVDLDRGQIIECATKLLSARGGNPVVHEEEGFEVVEDTTLGPSRPRLATRAGAPIFVGQGPWLRQMMRAFDRRAPRPAATSAHLRLRDELHAQHAGASVTAILPAALRQRLRDEVESGQKAGGPTFGAILEVGEVGLALRLGADAGPEGVDAVARCGTAPACATLHDFLERKRAALSSDWGVRLIGMASLLDATKLETQGAALTLHLDAPAAELARVASRAWTATMPAAPPRPPAASDAGAMPDETLRSRPAQRDR